MSFSIKNDVFGNSSKDLKEKRLFLFDMDGTIYKDDELFEGTKELLQLITEIGGVYVFITNNSSKSVNDYVCKVNSLGINCDEKNFFTSTQATILYLKKNYFGKKIYCQGTKSLINELVENNINVTEEVEDDIDVVVIGFDTELTSQKLRRTCQVLKKNIPFIATNPDLCCPVSFGFIPDCGSICGMIENATGKTPLYIGKPESTMVDIVREKLGYELDETVIIGDRLYTDILTGINAGIMSVCVLTGEATIDEIEHGKIVPTLTFDSVKDIYNSILYFKKNL